MHGVEVMNANRTELENKMADAYAEAYDLIKFAGSDNHVGASQKILAGMVSDRPIRSEAEFIKGVREGTMKPFWEKLGESMVF